MHGIRDLAPRSPRGAVTARQRWQPPPTAVRAGFACSRPAGSLASTSARETWDVSADLDTLARTGIVVVCSGVKSILDVGATLERLGTLNVTVLGYGTDNFPGFYLADSGHPAPWRVDRRRRSRRSCVRASPWGWRGAPSSCRPLAADEQLDRELHDRVLASSLERAEAGRRRQGRDALPARPLPQRDGRGEPRGERPARPRNAGLAARVATALGAT